MTESEPQPKDVADLLEGLAHKIRNDPAWGAGSPAKEGTGGITLFEGPEFGDGPYVGAIDLFADADAVTVTAETRNVEAGHVKVTLAEDRLFIGLGEGSKLTRKDVRLPVAVNEDAAVATFRNGVLDIVLPVRKPKK